MVAPRSLYLAVALLAIAVPGIAAPALPTEAQLAEFEKAAEKAVKGEDAAALLRLHKLDGLPEATRDLLAFQILLRLESKGDTDASRGGMKFLALKEGLAEYPEVYRSVVEDRKINGRKYVLNGTPVGLITLYNVNQCGNVLPVGYDAGGELRVLTHCPVDFDKTLYRLPAPIPAQGAAGEAPSPEAIRQFKESVVHAMARGGDLPGYTKGVPADVIDWFATDIQEAFGSGEKADKITLGQVPEDSERHEVALKVHRWGERFYGLNLPFLGIMSLAIPFEGGKKTVEFPVGLTPEGELKKAYPVPVIPPSKE